MYDGYLQGMTSESLLKALKDLPLLIFAIGLGILYLTVCLMDCIISRIQYYSKLNLNRAKHRVFQSANH
ncbi:MAG: hypothetical protein Q7U35_10165 [Methanobacteriaceae archaeon]|nr:hypothetical protein [Methanobacteriaceae archaeon]MDP2835425.1 hypothetical protein [Methanobacteriaceae archaeon]